MTTRTIQPSTTDTPILPGGLGVLLGRLVNRWIAGVIARHEREAALIMLRQLGDRELKDVGIDQHRIGDSLTDAARERTPLQRSRRPC
jgi:hypothetical protein